MLTGIALEEGLLRGIDQRVYEIFPEYFRADDDPRKLDISLAHVLRMTAGFQWDDYDDVLGDRWGSSGDLFRFLIEQPLVTAPGEAFNYSTALTHLLSGTLTKVSGSSTLAFATSRPFEPLGITCTRWDRDPQGYYYGGSLVWMTARDLAKFGLLFLRNGQWEDRQIVSAEWLRTASRLRVRTASAMGDYAYLWWKPTVSGYPVTLALGLGGQFVFLAPDLDLMMVSTALTNTGNPPDSVYTQPFQILSSYFSRLSMRALPASRRAEWCTRPTMDRAWRGARLRPLSAATSRW